MVGMRFSRQLTIWLAGMLLYISAQASTLTAARMWPSSNYTRITLESDAPFRFKSFTLGNPDRLVIDLKGIVPNKTLAKLAALTPKADPFVARVRSGMNRPGVLRVVFDLKMPVKPSVFALNPIGNYGYRLVIYLYAAAPAAPTLAPDQPAADKPVYDRANRTSKTRKLVPKFNRLLLIAIDAGHGGEDPGAIGASGSLEKHITLEIAKKLKEKIDAEPNMRGYLIRDGDYFIPLHERVNKARAVHADLFISLHADAFLRPEARGSSVFVLSENGASSAAARWLAKRENEADLIGGINFDVKDQYLKRTLIDLSQTATINDSLRLANYVLKEIGEVNTLHRDVVEQADFAVLKAPDIPSILIETAFLTNPEEEKRLIDDDHQDRLAGAILAGIKTYFNKHPQVGRTRVARGM